VYGHSLKSNEILILAFKKQITQPFMFIKLFRAKQVLFFLTYIL
jgi:membrane-anchored glycerophosphoryl diester phosphodiesterase (GDPDase)